MRSALTGRVIRVLALTALVATPVVVFTTAGSAGAAEVADQDALRDAFEDDLVSEIVLAGDITIDSSGDEGCDQMSRNSSVSLLINGAGHTIFKDEADCDADGQEGERIFRQRGDGTITFQDVTVSGGTKIGGEGGALKTDGAVVVNNSTFSQNQALLCDVKDSAVTDPEAEGYCGDAYGGAIFAEGSVTITNSVFSDNYAAEGGGAVFTESNITVTESQFLGNSAGTEAFCWCSGGGFLALGGADVSGSQVAENSAGCIAYCGGSGGGFWSAGPASVVNSTLENNATGCEFSCEGVGGGFSASGFGQNSAAADAIGSLGAAAADPGQVIVTGTVFDGNEAVCGINDEVIEGEGSSYSCGSGGGFYAYAADLVDVQQSTFTANNARCLFEISDVSAESAEICGFGGGFFTQYVSEVSVDSSTFNANTATIAGGAISNGEISIGAGAQICELEGRCGGSDLTIVNSTITENTSGIFGAITSLGEGDTVTLINDTIVGNVLDIEGLLGPLAAAEPELGANVVAFSLTSFGTIVTGGVGVGELAPVTGNCEYFDSDSQGYNFTDDETCGFDDPTDIVTTPNDPQLLTLSNYGGPTNTMRPEGEIEGTTLVTLSPVVDKIPAALCAVDVDQRGVTRPQFVVANACDIGAVEITAAEITISPEVVIITPRFTG